MFINTSLAGTGWVVFLLSLIARWAGLDMDQGELTEMAVAILQVAGFIAALIGQFRRGDLRFGLIRK